MFVRSFVFVVLSESFIKSIFTLFGFSISLNANVLIFSIMRHYSIRHSGRSKYSCVAEQHHCLHALGNRVSSRRRKAHVSKCRSSVAFLFSAPHSIVPRIHINHWDGKQCKKSKNSNKIAHQVELGNYPYSK